MIDGRSKQSIASAVCAVVELTAPGAYPSSFLPLPACRICFNCESPPRPLPFFPAADCMPFRFLFSSVTFQAV